MLHTARACNFVLDGALPDWIQLLPPGPDIVGADGRRWTLPDPHPLIAAFTARNKPLVIDWEHASEHRAPVGLDAPAAGWIDQIEDRAGAIYGHVEWTPKAAQQIAAKEYRFLSPVFTYQKTDARIIELVSAGLTNQPNLNLTALNREESPMPVSLPILTALDLSADTSEAGVIDAIANFKSALLTATNRAQTPPLDKFIPRADYDAALARATNAEQRLAALEQERRDQAIETALNAALSAGQICPATVEFYRAGCRQEGGLQAFQDFLKTAPKVLGEAPALNRQPPTTTAPSPELAAVTALFGHSVEDLNTYGGSH